MNLNTTLKLLSAVAAMTVAAAANATAYCPGDSGTYTAAGAGYTAETTGTPGSGPDGYTLWLSIEGGLVGSDCYYRAGNLDTPLPNGPGGLTGWEDFGLGDYTLKFTTAQAPGGSGLTFGAGSFTLSGWDFSEPLYMGFHFGQGAGDPDSFIVRLDPSFFTNGSGTSAFAFSGELGLSNIYLWGTRCTNGDCGGEEVPEPGSLALLGMGLAGLALIRRRRRS